ncbi:MAG TPA: hypothetical protein VGR60_03665, partial [Gemmatimonadales bacterium]|nr:hypothetical protein [Gemmatimonadales bacterium]
MRARLVAGLALLAACSSNTGGGTDVAPRTGHGRARPMAPVLIRPAPPARYSVYRLDTITTRLPNGTETPQVVGRTLLVTVSITPPPAGTTGDARIAITLDSVTVDSGAPEMARAPFVGVAGTTWSGSVSATGLISGLVPDRPSTGAEAVTPDLQRWLPVVPPTGARAGDAWTDTVASTYPFSNLNLRVADTLIAAWTAQAGTAPGTLDLRATGTITRTGTSNIVTLMGGGTRTAQYTLGADGTLEASSGVDSVVMKISVLAVGQSVSVRQMGRFTVT